MNSAIESVFSPASASAARTSMGLIAAPAARGVRRAASHHENQSPSASPGREHDGAPAPLSETQAAPSQRSPRKRGTEDDRARRLKAALVRRIGEDRFNRWFNQAKIEVSGESVRITADTAFVAKWIEAQFAADIHAVAAESLAMTAQLEIRVAPEAAAAEDRPSRDGSRNGASTSTRGRGHDGTASDEPSEEPKPATRPARLHDLGDFVVGSSNRMAHVAACRLAEGEQMQGLSPLFIHGECGVGKTHLLQGICRRFIERHPGTSSRVRYVTGEQFTNEFIAALRTNAIDSFRQRVRKLLLLAIDDVHFLANKFKTQSEFQCTIDAIDFGGARVVMASDNHPHHIRRFNQSLVSRFVSGMVVRIERPDRELRAALIRRLATARNLRLSEAAVEELASNVGTSVRELEGAMTRLAAWRAMMHPDAPQTEVGLLLVQQVLNEDRVRPNHIVRIAAVIEAVCHRLAITKADLLGSGRHRRVVIGRSMVAYLGRELTTMSFPEIAQSLGRDNHSTVHTADQRLREQLKRDERLDPNGGETAMPLRELADLLRRDICRNQ